MTLAAPNPGTPDPAASCAGAMAAQDWTTAFARCTQEAETSSAARRNLGILYAEGRGVARDERLASVHLGLAAQDIVQPDTQAILLMAERWDRGLGVAVDRSRAAGLWEVAAAMGIPRAFPIIAARFAAGDGRRRSDSAAFVWYARAADAGDVPSMTRVAERYTRGIGVAKDENRAATWYSRAAEQGDPEAQYQVAMLLFRGKFFPRDDAAGLLWLERAARQGHVNALAELARRRRPA
jgi:TPR repeat protein